VANDIDEVKSKIDIVSLIGERVPLKKAGRNYKALCPFHSEKTPSFMVSPELSIYKCFGCNAGGDAIAFLMEYEGMEFYEALKFLADRTGVKLTPFAPGDKGEKEKFYEINSLAARFYHFVLLKHPKGRIALNYLLKNRKLKIETIKTFQLGYSPDAPFAIKSFLVDRKKISPADLQKAGLVYAGEGGFWDRFRGRIIFPLNDHRGNVCGFAGRILPEKETLGMAKYINTPETPVYQKSKLLYGLNITRASIKKAGKAVVVEGEIDLISSFQAGVNNIVAIKGSAFTGDQTRLLSRFAEEVTLALDADLAGDAAARQGIVAAEAAGLQVKVARLGDYKDPDELARKSPQKLKQILDSAVGVWDFIIESIFSKFDASAGEGKAKISQEIIPTLSLIENKIVQAHYLEAVGKKLGVDASVIASEMDKYNSKRDLVWRADDALKPEKGKRELLEETLLSLAFSLNASDFLKGGSSLIKSAFPKRILEEYKTFVSRRPFDPAGFANALPEELRDGFAQIVLKADFEEQTPEAKKKEFMVSKASLKIQNLKEKLKEVARDIEENELGGKRNKLKAAQEKFVRLTKKLNHLEEKHSSAIIF